MTQSKRRISEFLPEVIQTDVLKKFFAATGDHMFQPERVEYLSSYIGQKPSYYDPTRDQYVREINRDRTDYQVDPITVSRNSDNLSISHALFYDDLINKLRFQGALVNDHNRLFSAEYYSWGLPIDIDKFLNYQNYVWLPTGPLTITLLSTTEASAIGQQSTYSYTGLYQRANSSEVIDGAIAPLVFTTGLKVRFSLDIDVSIREREFIVEGVGTQIRLVGDTFQSFLAWENPIEWDSDVWDSNPILTETNYVLIGRGSVNRNPWSLGNRWFHKQILEISGTTVDNINSISGQRPILEFFWDIRLWNFATRSRGFVNLIDTETTNINQIIGGNNTTTIDGVPLDDNMTVLFTNLRDPANPNQLDPQTNNRIYVVTNLRNENSIVLQLLSNDDDPTGAPLDGDGVQILQGTKNRDTNWYYRQNRWVLGQSRVLPEVFSERYRAALNQPPLFELFDVDGNSLADPAVWPGSSFNGSTLINYVVDPNGTVDSELGFAPVTEELSARNFVFDVSMVSSKWDYANANTRSEIGGFKFWQATPVGGEPQFLNNWFVSSFPSRQYVVNQYVTTANQREFAIDQMPLLSAPGPAAITVAVGVESKTLGVDYQLADRKVVFTQPLDENQFVQIRTWAGLNNTATAGFFEIPSNLQANPNNQQISRFSVAEVLEHFTSIIANQSGLVGDPRGSNNYRDTASDQSLGTEILQHRAPMLKLMGLNAPSQTDVFSTSNSVVDPFSATLWAQNEYLRFYNKVVNSLLAVYDGGGLTSSQPPQTWLATALARVNVGKTKTSTWANSGFDLVNGAYCSQESNNPTWVPPSAARLGAAPCYYPRVFFDTSQPQTNGVYPLSLRCHNGALLILKDVTNQNLGTILNNQTETSDPSQLSHPVAQAWLLFELSMYESLPLQYRSPESVPAVDPRTVFSGKYRQTSYSRQDQLRVQSPSWQKWLTFNQIDAFRNTSFDVTDPFTWNYSSCVDRDNQSVPGHYRGIYFYYFDTDTPHTTPWQMLGFSQKPTWWDSEYGAAPYTSGNLHMWEDLAQGLIAHGDRAGLHPAWARPGLLNNIPVDSVGNLLPPFEAGIVTSLPSVVEASADWKFGDRGPLENVWLTTADSDFLQTQWAYLAHPAQWVEQLWDGTRQKQIFSTQRYSQWIYSDTNTRKSSSEFYVHRENPQDVLSLPAGSSTYYGSCGIQHWISERLVSESRNVTTYFGNLIRGLEPNLGHRMGGFTDGRNMRLLVDSFGLSTNDSLLLPQEDVDTILLRSNSTGEYFYTGVIVEYRGRAGWRVIGYDSVNPFFEIVPSDPNGPRNNVVIDNQTVVEYKRGLNTRRLIPYGTVLATRQEVYDFLISLGRAQAADGWIFDQYDSTAGLPRNWSLSAREFLFWSQGPWAAGTYIALSPLASLIKFSSAFGTIQNIGGVVNGSYSILDRNGVTINIANVDFLRMDSEVSARTLNDQGIYGLRVYTTTLEHAFVFNNRTIFNDLVYDPLLNQRQSRFKLYSFRTLDWTGRLEAPGYLVTQTVATINNVITVSNQIIPNLEKSANDLRKLFEIDLSTPYTTAIEPNTSAISTISQSVNQNLTTLARHNVGYQSRAYLVDLLVDDNVAFQFYQGMIAQKGTPISVDKLLRNNNVLAPDEQFYYFEEFAFRSGIYGYDNNTSSIDLQIKSNDVESNPQQVEILSNVYVDDPRDDVITYVAGDSRIITSSEPVSPFLLRTSYTPASSDLPTAGYVLVDEADYVVTDDAALQNLYQTQVQAILLDPTQPVVVPGDVVWQAIDSQRGWNIYRLLRVEVAITSVVSNPFDSQVAVITTDVPHQLSLGDRVIIFGVVNAGVSIDNTFEVLEPTSTTFQISIQVTQAGTGGTIWVYRSIRFSNISDRDQAAIPGGWKQGDLAYVDGTAATPSIVTKKVGANWTTIRETPLKTDPNGAGPSTLYNLTTKSTISTLTLWDPVKNCVPGVLAQEIAFKTPYDPARYTVDPSGEVGTNPDDAWGNDQVGLVWWNLSTTRFLDYEIGTDSYRRQHWGKIAPGTSIDIYEWVRSTVPPASWKTLVAAGTNLSAIGSSNRPSGQVDNDFIPYVARQQQNSAGQLQTVYYFWVKNSTTVPDLPWRRISTSTISAAITEPQNYSISWWAPIGPRTALIGNIGDLLEGDSTVWQLNWYRDPEFENIHKEYTLSRPEDPRSNPDQSLWFKMIDSLVEFDREGNSVPDLRLRPADTFGILDTPRQTMFSNSSLARQTLVTLINQLLTDADLPPTSDASRSQYLENFFNSSEPEPENVNQLDAVRLATTANLVSYYTNGQEGVGAQLVSAAIETLRVDGIPVEINDRILVKNQTAGEQNGIYLVVNPGCALANINLVGNYVVVDGVAQLSGLTAGDLVINSEMLIAGQRILLTDQTSSDQNGLWLVSDAGSGTTVWSLSQLSNLDNAIDNPLSTSWVLTRSRDFDSARQQLAGAQTTVNQGATQALSVWNQTNPDINLVGFDLVEWALGPAPTVWDLRRENLAQLRALDYMVNNGTKVLVAAGVETNSRWTIWQWELGSDGIGDWVQLRVQSYVTPLFWSQIDWYASGYSAATVPTLVFETLSDRDSYLDFVDGDLVDVDNTGSGEWAWYVYSSTASNINDKWTVVAQQNGTIALSEALWDYETSGMGFDGSGFAADYQGFEYDSRQELKKIIEGLWIDARGTSGLLKIGSRADDPNQQINEPNQVFFAMINQVLASQTFVDWAFKTSFINLRGFAEELLPTPYYTTNKINSMIEYLNETKPYHAKIRQFVDWRKGNELYNSASSDFDKPPYKDARGTRILDPNNTIDQQILSTGIYRDWYTNYLTNPSLVRQTRTRMLFDRVGCATEWWYAPGWSDGYPVVNETVSTLMEWISIVLEGDRAEGTVVEVKTPQWTLLRRNGNNSTGLANWDQLQAGLIFDGTVDQIIRNIDEAFLVLNQVVPVGYTVMIKIDNLTTPNRYWKLASNTGTLSDWTLGAYQHLMGAADRIAIDYQPTLGMPPSDSPLLISGCAPKLSTLDGLDFQTEDAWDKNFWDNVRGWDYSEDAFDIYDQNVTGGVPVGYWIYKGTGTRKQFGLPKASQDPNNLKVWVNGSIKTSPADWFVANYVSQALVSSGGLGYTFNDIISLSGGTYFPPVARQDASFVVSGVDGGGGITGVAISNSGQGYSVGDQLSVVGGTPTVDALLSVSNVDTQGRILSVNVSSPGSGYLAGDVLSNNWAPGTPPLIASPARFKVSGVDFLGRIIAVTLIDPGRYMMVPSSNVVPVVGGTGINATVNVLCGGRVLEFFTAPSEPTSNRPNVWIVENGSTFSPAVNSILDAAFDGARLNRPDLEGGHPEELNKIWPRSTVYYDVYTVPSAGWGGVVTRTYQGDGITDQFDIGQDITYDGQVWVYAGGQLQTWGITNDYVINYEYMRVLFVNGAPTGRVSIISVGFGGASKSLGNWSITNPGQQYNLGDTVVLTGGFPSTPTQVQIIAVKAVGITIQNGGQNYQVGDRLLFKYGASSQTLIVSVASVSASGTTQGIITSVNIDLPGYYTNLTYGLNSWFTDGLGSGADLLPVWGAADLFVTQRGIYYQEPAGLIQSSVTPQPGLPATGNGIEVAFGRGHIREQIRVDGNGVQDSVILIAPANQNTILVTWNGEVFTNYGFDSNDIRILVFNVIPQPGDVVYVTVYNSALYSLNNSQNFVVSLPSLTYGLTNPPGILPAATKNVLVYSNGSRLRAPYFWQGTGDGVTTSFDIGIVAQLGFSPTTAADVTIWADNTVVPFFNYVVNNPAPGQITFAAAPAAGTNLIVQVADTTVQNYDYLINLNDIELSSWAVAGGETITVVSFSEDSQTSLRNDQFAGTPAALYLLTATPSEYGSVQVFFNGTLMEQNWDYQIVKVVQNTGVQFSASYAHVPADLIEVFYSTALPAKPGVALRMFTNIYDDTAWLRLSDHSSTKLNADLNWNSDYALVADGSRLPDASDANPGVVWIGAERLEYRSKTFDAVPAYPNQVRLGGLNRGSMGTPGGVNNRFASEKYSGNGQTVYFPSSFSNPYVFVDGSLKREIVDYELVINPVNLAPGFYVKFTDASIPPLGDQNVVLAQAVTTLATTNVSHPSGSLVRDASANQFVPAGYIWPMGNQGIQYSAEPQTPFLLAEPGSRLE